MPVDIKTTSYNGYWRGLMRRQRLVDHPELYAAEALNVELRGNVLQRRLGIERVNQTTGTADRYGDASSRKIFELFQPKWRINSGGPDEILVAAGSLLQKVGPTPTTITNARLPVGAPARAVPQYPVHFTQFNNQVFIVDGTNLNLNYTIVSPGTGQLQMIGINGPWIAPTVAVLGAGVLNGTYSWRYTWVNSLTQAESEPSPISTGLATANQSVRLTIPDPHAFNADPLKNGDLQIDRVRVYRTVAWVGTPPADPGIWLYVGEKPVTGGATSTFDDNVSDKSLGGELEEFVNNPPPDRMRLVVPWLQGNRLLGVAADTPSILRYTDLIAGRLKPESWPPENVIFIALDTGDEIVGIFCFSDSVLIFGRRSIFRLRGTTPDNLVLDVVQFQDDRTAIGSFGQKTLVQIDDLVMNSFVDGAYGLSRFVDTEGGFNSQRLSRTIDDLWATRNALMGLWAHGVYLRSRKQFRLWVPLGTNTEATECWVFQLDIAATENVPGGWTRWVFSHPEGGSTQVFITASLVIETTDGDACYVGTTDGYIGIMDRKSTDFWHETPAEPGFGYPFVWETVPVMLADDEREARLRYMDLIWAAASDSLVIVTPITDFGTEWPALTFALPAEEGFTLDVSILDVDRLAGGDQRATTRATLLTRGGWHALRLRCDEPDVSFLIEKWRLLWQPLATKARPVGGAQELPGFPLPQAQEGWYHSDWYADDWYEGADP